MDQGQARKMNKALKDIKQEIEENDLDNEVVKLKRKPKKLVKKVKSKEKKVANKVKSKAKKVKPAKKVKSTKKKVVEKKVKKETITDGYTATDLADELDMEPKDLRVLLRKSGIKKPGSKWIWANKKSAPIKELKALMKGGSLAKKDKVKPKAKKSKAKKTKK